MQGRSRKKPGRELLCPGLLTFGLAGLVAVACTALGAERVSAAQPPRESQNAWRASWVVAPDAADPLHVPPNQHYFFRKVVQVRAPVKSAVCFVSADDMVKLTINGEFVGQGPAPAYPQWYYFNTFDVTDFLVPGQPNVLAAHVYYQGLVNRVWVSGDGLTGLILQLVIQYKDGRCDTVVTDSTWRVLTCSAYSGEPTGYKTQFLENVDGRLLPWGWTEASFDDADWPRAVELGVPPLRERRLVPQPTPPLQFSRLLPQQIRRLGPGHFLLDFGKETVGTLHLRVHGPRGHKVEIRHGEELAGPDSVRYKLRANCTYREFYTLARRRDEEFEFYDYKGFRYVELLNLPGNLTREDVWVRERHYPFDSTAASFETSDTLLQAIWNLCVRSVELGSQEVYVDCPTREKGQYLGDSYVEGLSQFYATGDWRLQRKALENFAQSAIYKPTLLCVAPSSYRQEIADYSLEWVLFLEEYTYLSGDTAFAARMWPTVKGLLKGFARWEGPAGLLEAVPTMNLVDWPPNLRDDYDMKRAEQGVNTVLNAFYLGALNAASRLAGLLGHKADSCAYAERASARRDAFNRLLLDHEKGLYVDALGSTHSSLHANVLPLYFDLAPDSLRPRLVDFIRRKGMACGVYFSTFVLRALYRNGADELAYRLLTSRGKHSWANMLRKGATATLEAWDP
ncbi:MAG: family 78 glycoside hydrolase catalytic domain, partial [Calditrichaeota bacterium]|nr:family 78 glycoside hydrolase catalytic domain [Calditrichota bacterium]